MRKYNYFDDNDINNSIYDDKTDPYNILMSVVDGIKHINFNRSKKIAAKSITVARDLAQKVKDKEPINIKEIDLKQINLKEINLKEIELPEIHFNKRDKKRLKILPFLLFVVSIVIFIGVFVNSIESENERIALFNKSAGEVCIEKINTYGTCNYERMNEDYGDSVNRLTGTCFARELDFDNDGVSELLITYNDGGTYYNEVWGFDGDTFVPLYNKPASTVADKTAGSWITLYRHNNKYYIGTNATDDGAEIDLYTLKGDAFHKKYTCQYDNVTETFTIRKKADVTSFERVMLSCIKERAAERRVEDFATVTDNFTSGEVVAAANLAKDDKQKMYQAYYALVQEYNNDLGIAKMKSTDNTAYLEGLGVVKLVDFDGDKVEELMLIYCKSVGVRDVDSDGNYTSRREDKYFCDIYRWTGEKAVRAFQHEDLSGMHDNGTDKLFILKHDGKKTHYCANTYVVENSGNTITSTSRVYEMVDIAFETTYRASLRNSYGYTTRKIDGDNVSKSEFEKEQDTVALFCNNNEYNTETFTVGYVKRKAGNSDDVKKQLDETVKEIKKLNKQYVHE